ncbi:MAG: hypothetical protein IT213_05795 [Cytophagales bacterium]|nr:hypothetical protein [Cytophagales bacterium]
MTDLAPSSCTNTPKLSISALFDSALFSPIAVLIWSVALTVYLSELSIFNQQERVILGYVTVSC